MLADLWIVPWGLSYVINQKSHGLWEDWLDCQKSKYCCSCGLWASWYSWCHDAVSCTLFDYDYGCHKVPIFITFVFVRKYSKKFFKEIIKVKTLTPKKSRVPEFRVQDLCLSFIFIHVSEITADKENHLFDNHHVVTWEMLIMMFQLLTAATLYQPGDEFSLLNGIIYTINKRMQ